MIKILQNRPQHVSMLTSALVTRIDQDHRGVHVTYHPDSWYWHRDWDHDHDYHWRGHHDGRGYWRNGVWIAF